MPSGEHELPPTDNRPSLFVEAARFPTERQAGRAYVQARDLIHRTRCDLSAYRLQLDRAWLVAILGTLPPRPLARTLRRILAAGEPLTLPADVTEILLHRRAEASQRGPWVERHHRPGQPL